jgi:hypothetical protein
MAENDIMLEKAAQIQRLEPSNTKFSMKNGFLSMTFTEDGEERTFERIFLHRAFPHELLWTYISVLGDNNKEIGLIYDIADFDEETTRLLKTELERKYYSPVVTAIHSLKERYGFSYWRVTVSDGRTLNFTMQDTFRNIVRTGEDGAILLDVDGNRFVLESITALDRKSYRRIELYL